MVKINDLLSLQGRTSDPTIATEGDVYYNSDRKALRLYDGSMWASIKANLPGDFISFFDVIDDNGSPQGIAQVGNEVWVVDTDDNVYRYNSLTRMYINSFPLTSNNRQSRGIAQVGNEVWVVDTDDNVYRYNSSTGAYIDAFSSSSNARGITQVGNEAWIVRSSSRSIIRYNITSPYNFISSINLRSVNDDPRGIAQVGNEVWVVDGDNKVYRYNSSTGVYIDAFNSALSSPQGIAQVNTEIWILNSNGNIYRYQI